MTNTITNVPRELLEVIEQTWRIHYQGGPATTDIAADVIEKGLCQLRALLSAPSPAGLDGLDVVAWRIGFPNNAGYKVYAQRQPWAYEQYGVPSVIVYEVQELCRLSDTHAIIDGLLGEVAEQEEAANQWRELALQFDRHRMTAMAHIRAAAGGDKSAIEALGVFAALPPIPGHEITAAHERQAQRIGELEGLLRDSAELIKHGVFEDGYCCCGSSVDSHGLGDGHSPVDALAYHAGQVCERIDAALPSSKDSGQ